MIDMFEDLDDVQNVYTNVEFTDEVMAEVRSSITSFSVKYKNSSIGAFFYY